MNQYDEDRVREALEPYHSRIRAVIVRAHGECWSVKRHMAEKGFGPVLYPRTDANDMFDAVARNALREFSDNPDVRVIKEAQTVKICFAETVLARFKKGDENNLGRNLVTQAVLDFVSIQGTLPGLPPAAAKVEILYATNEIGDGIHSVMIAARDHNQLLWAYPLDEAAEDVAAVPLFRATPEHAHEDEEPLVKARVRNEYKSQRGTDKE